MGRNNIKICVIIAMLGLIACSPPAMEEAALAEPVAIEDTAIKGVETDCPSTTAGDGIGGTGCPAID